MFTLSDFFTQLGQDAQLMKDYKQNPEAVMFAHGLSIEEMAAVMAGDLKKLKSLSGDGDYQSFLLVNHGNRSDYHENVISLIESKLSSSRVGII
ncbi:hypothetical protein [Shewanella morhuae]|uniref:Extradiol ring-cleavage dioxygenase LigAB LigA subunit domain-containing protein n=1 Tax=Shewanella morhuae TaxID=365591 RepID=A0A379ZEN3_9GAMM|nr:Uncharacterised protein [Shewanella morhuae]